MWIVFDLDNTICNLNKELMKRGIPIDIYPAKEVTPDFWLSPEGKLLMEKAEPIDWVVAILRFFKQTGHKIIIATARDESLYRLTLEWLIEHRIPFDEIVFTPRKVLVDADLYFDDSPLEILELASNGKDVVPVPWPYNRHLTGNWRAM